MIDIINDVKPGQRKKFSMPIGSFFDDTKLFMPIEVIKGIADGPVMFISAAIHGDEVIGVEIIQKILNDKAIENICGTLIAIPIVNAFGYNNISRYLPDRRDLNRCFPGSPLGSLAARIAYSFMNAVVAKCQYGIDIHSGAIHRYNMPQIRISNNKMLPLAEIFGAPLILESSIRDGTLRQSAEDKGVSMLLYEAGEALRFDEDAINIGVRGVFSVMRHIGMIEQKFLTAGPKSIVAKTSYWVRAPESGSLRVLKFSGYWVEENEVLGIITNPYGEIICEVKSKISGWIICHPTMPLINLGNALFHIASVDDEKADVSPVCFYPHVVRDQDVDIENEGW